MAPPLGKLPLRDADGDLVMEVPRYLSMVSVERTASPPKRRLGDADSLDTSPSSRDGRKVELGVQVRRQEFKRCWQGAGI